MQNSISGTSLTGPASCAGQRRNGGRAARRRTRPCPPAAWVTQPPTLPFSLVLQPQLPVRPANPPTVIIVNPPQRPIVIVRARRAAVVRWITIPSPAWVLAGTRPVPTGRPAQVLTKLVPRPPIYRRSVHRRRVRILRRASCRRWVVRPSTVKLKPNTTPSTGISFSEIIVLTCEWPTTVGENQTIQRGVKNNNTF